MQPDSRENLVKSLNVQEFEQGSEYAVFIYHKQLPLNHCTVKETLRFVD
ncbi:hypothetical protein AB3508_05040 [Acinetobacter baumannii]